MSIGKLLPLLSFLVFSNFTYANFWHDMNAGVEITKEGNSVGIACHNCYVDGSNDINETIALVTKAIENGADVIEIDVYLYEGQWYVGHQENLPAEQKLESLVDYANFAHSKAVFFIEIKTRINKDGQNTEHYFSDLVDLLVGSGIANRDIPIVIRSSIQPNLKFIRQYVINNNLSTKFKFGRVLHHDATDNYVDCDDESVIGYQCFIDRAVGKYDMVSIDATAVTADEAISYARSKGVAVTLFGIKDGAEMHGSETVKDLKPLVEEYRHDVDVLNITRKDDDDLKSSLLNAREALETYEDFFPVIDFLREECRQYIIDLSPESKPDYALIGTTRLGNNCTVHNTIKYFSSTHETEALGEGNMFAIGPPLSEAARINESLAGTGQDVQYDQHGIWDIVHDSSGVEMVFNNRENLGPVKSNNGRLVYDGYFGIFQNFQVPASIMIDHSKNYMLTVEFEVLSQLSDANSEFRLTLGSGYFDGVLPDQINKVYITEMNLVRSSSWDYCKVPAVAVKGNGPYNTLRCDPTTEKFIDYRSINRSNEIVYFNANKLFPPVRQGNIYRYSIPISHLQRSYLWSDYNEIDWNELVNNGFYFGIEHHRGSNTRVVLKEMYLEEKNSSQQQQQVIQSVEQQMNDNLEVNNIPSVLGILDSVYRVSNGVRLRGWACTEGYSGTTDIKVFAGDSALVGQYKTSKPSSYSNSQCNSQSDHVFDIVVPKSKADDYQGDPIVITATNKYSEKNERIYTGSKKFPRYSYAWSIGSWSSCNANIEQTRTVECKENGSQVVNDDYCPKPKPNTQRVCPTENLGILDRANYTGDNFNTYGWACGKNHPGVTEVHLRARTPGASGIGTWIGTFFTRGSSSYSDNQCGVAGKHVFSINIPRNTALQYAGKEVVVTAKNNITNEWYVVRGSGNPRY